MQTVRAFLMSRGSFFNERDLATVQLINRKWTLEPSVRVLAYAPLWWSLIAFRFIYTEDAYGSLPLRSVLQVPTTASRNMEE